MSCRQPEYRCAARSIHVATLVQPAATADVTAGEIIAAFGVSVTTPFLLTRLHQWNHRRRRVSAVNAVAPGPIATERTLKKSLAGPSQAK